MADRLRLMDVAYNTASYVDGGIAVGYRTGVLLKLTVIRIIKGNEIGSHRSQTAAAVNRAEHGATLDVYFCIATNTTCGKGATREATSAAVHIAF